MLYIQNGILKRTILFIDIAKTIKKKTYEEKDLNLLRPFIKELERKYNRYLPFLGN